MREASLFVSPVGSPTLYKLSLSQLAAQDMRLDRGPFYAIRPSPDNNLVALVTSDWKLWVVSSDYGNLVALNIFKHVKTILNAFKRL